MGIFIIRCLSGSVNICVSQWSPRSTSVAVIVSELICLIMLLVSVFTSGLQQGAVSHHYPDMFI